MDAIEVIGCVGCLMVVGTIIVISLFAKPSEDPALQDLPADPDGP